jgi:hypothetical protein
MKKYLSARIVPYNPMKWTAAATIKLTGPGTISWFRRLTPDYFKFLDRIHDSGGDSDDDADDDDDTSDDDGTVVTKTMVNSARQGEKNWAGVIIDCLLMHQDLMTLHCRTNQLLGQKSYDWDDFQFVVCELRGFVYKPRPRRKPVGFVEEMCTAHRRWHLVVALPFCWETTECEKEQPKRARTQ